jgi:hypothetical protein
MSSKAAIHMDWTTTATELAVSPEEPRKVNGRKTLAKTVTAQQWTSRVESLQADA